MQNEKCRMKKSGESNVPVASVAAAAGLRHRCEPHRHALPLQGLGNQSPLSSVNLRKALKVLVRTARAVMNGARCGEITPSSTIFNEVQRLWAKNKKNCGAGARPPPRGQPACFQLRRADGIGRKNEAKTKPKREAARAIGGGSESQKPLFLRGIAAFGPV
jgi:hypothetical protein